MNCPMCRADNRVNSRFCLECGASFVNRRPTLTPFGVQLCPRQAV